VIVLVGTVKVSNFAPHENFEDLFPKCLLTSKRLLRKNKGIKGLRMSLLLLTWFYSFSVPNSLKEATGLARKYAKLP
jgi:hypothetical protein